MLSTNGDTHLGGEDFHQRVAEYFVKMFKSKHSKDLRSDKKAIQELRKEVEESRSEPDRGACSNRASSS